ncbi:MAG: dihydrolipoyl dehydrogenase family protein [Planctomycetota bacterium]|jgi:pyruvate/2-oxoglutarate dehydrogenase complex dihydrolipoamide dehydrogenase (E3) component
MGYDYDVITVGLGPAGMAVSIMGSEMGLKVCAVEKHRVGGECMNVGCIPSKALLRMAKMRHNVSRLWEYALEPAGKLPAVTDPFRQIQKHLSFIADKKTMKMFDKVDMVYQEGAARFVDSHTLQVGEKRISAKRIFLCAGTQPAVPNFPGLKDLPYLTNNNLFELDSIPERMIVIGGGAIACEMAQAFARLGSQITMIIRGPRLMWREYQGATDLLEETFQAEGITILREDRPTLFEQKDGVVVMTTEKGETVESDTVLVAAGRAFDFSELNLNAAGVEVGSRGEIRVDPYLRTSAKHIFACGDCNGFAQFSHAAMHQGMIAIMNSMAFWPFRQRYQNYTVPWTVFTEPQISHVGPRETQLQERGIRFEAIEVKYGDYGAAIAERVEPGFIRALVSPTGRIHAVTIIGEGSGEMINEWALAVQKKLRIHDMMMLQHSFPTMGFLTKRTAETWMMKKMKSEALKNLCRFFYRL